MLHCCIVVYSMFPACLGQTLVIPLWSQRCSLQASSMNMFICSQTPVLQVFTFLQRNCKALYNGISIFGSLSRAKAPTARIPSLTHAFSQSCQQLLAHLMLDLPLQTCSEGCAGHSGYFWMWQQPLESLELLIFFSPT